MTGAENPLSSLDDWDDDVLRRYPEDREPGNAKQTEEFRSYGDAPCAYRGVRIQAYQRQHSAPHEHGR